MPHTLPSPHTHLGIDGSPPQAQPPYSRMSTPHRPCAAGPLRHVCTSAMDGGGACCHIGLRNGCSACAIASHAGSNICCGSMLAGDAARAGMGTGIWTTWCTGVGEGKIWLWRRHIPLESPALGDTCQACWEARLSVSGGGCTHMRLHVTIIDHNFILAHAGRVHPTVTICS